VSAGAASRPDPESPEPERHGPRGPEGGRVLSVLHAGVVPYPEAVALQARLVEDRRAGRIGDTLVLLEHPPVITLGARTHGRSTHIVASDEQLQREGVTVHQSGRGGDVTYHGPGQLVGYPILELRAERRDVHRYVRDLETALIVALAAFGIEGKRVAGLSGVWVGDEGREEKVAAIGVRISRWITSHGFALNVATDLQHFDFIVPCGIADRGVTSIERHLGRAVRMADVEAAVVAGMREVFATPASQS
jgi:lipoyl(octanoyl) transferase